LREPLTRTASEFVDNLPGRKTRSPIPKKDFAEDRKALSAPGAEEFGYNKFISLRSGPSTPILTFPKNRKLVVGKIASRRSMAMYLEVIELILIPQKEVPQDLILLFGPSQHEPLLCNLSLHSNLAMSCQSRQAS